MGRVKGSKNINSNVSPQASTMSPDERIRFIANLIIDKIIEDQNNGQILLHKLNIKEL